MYIQVRIKGRLWRSQMKSLGYLHIFLHTISLRLLRMWETNFCPGHISRSREMTASEL